jgi:hypothetical protein
VCSLDSERTACSCGNMYVVATTEREGIAVDNGWLFLVGRGCLTRSSSKGEGRLLVDAMVMRYGAGW